MKNSWVRFGLIWGVFMALIMNVGFPLFDGTGINWLKVGVTLPVWIIFGLIFGYVSRKKTPKKQ
ncbi:hypothetical protein HYN59_09170 [Flavobacterium album]|uniref:Uncharacterized protein n=1 Tax=Flavobacterium album TaxID=2175091 RepID=A0A2S1QY06_9FLAO|nr:hypothetical protein [Flavobacterium album]AWH85278.1 hypothetical protein HYN59_09170 [Flavobacterium album]